MSRRRAARATASVTYDQPWTEGLRELFDLVADDWAPPATVRLKRTVRTLTVTAIFRTAAGLRFTAHARIRLQGGEWVQTEATLCAAFSLKVA